MGSINQKLESLKLERDSLLNKHLNIHFDNEDEGRKYIQDNKAELTRLNELFKEIKELEWQLMSPQQRKEYLEEQQKIKEKYADD
jgi:hypothetical protein